MIAALAPIAAPDAQVVVTQLDGAQLISPVTDAAAPAPASTYDHGLIEPDGRVSLAPAAAVPAGYPTAVRAGNSIVVATSSTDAPPTVARHRLGTDGWEPVAIDAPAGSFILLTAMGDAVLATAVGPLDAVGGGRETSVVIGADGAARKVAAPPDPNASPAGGFTVWTGSKLLVMARDSAADDRLLRRPYAFDPASGEWKALALPDWVTCRDDCGWYGPHQGGDSFLLVWTGTEVVLHAFVGGPGVDRTMTGAYDPSADRWRKLDDPPMPLELAHAIVARGVVRAVPTSSFRQEHPDHAGVLDLATGRWSTEAIPVATAGRSGDAPGVLEIRQTVGKTMASAYSMGEPVPTVAQAVFDETSARWRAAGAGDQLAWRRLANGTVTLQDLAG